MATETATYPVTTKPIRVPVKGATLKGVMGLVKYPRGTVIFSHGSGSSHLSPRNQYVARILQDHHYHTLLVDLLTEDEDRIPSHRFEMDLLAERLAFITIWAAQREEFSDTPFAYFGASTGSATALKVIADPDLQQRCMEVVASQRSESFLNREVPASTFKRIKTVISRGGRPDLVLDQLPMISIPVLLMVGELDYQVLSLNKKALERLGGPKELHVIPGASHLFEEGDSLQRVAEQTANWLHRFFTIK